MSHGQTASPCHPCRAGSGLRLRPLAQSSDDDAAAIRREHWVFGVLASGGSGLFDRDNVQIVRAGVSVGRVMTGELGKGFLRGTFELDAEIMPVDYVLWGGYRNVYGSGINPVVMKWNFTHGKKLIPYFLAQGGVPVHRPQGPSGRHLHGQLSLRSRRGLQLFPQAGPLGELRFPRHAPVQRIAGRSQSRSQFQPADLPWLQLVEAIA